MVFRSTLPLLSARIALAGSTAVFLVSGCGGVDTIPFDDATVPSEGAAAETSTADAADGSVDAPSTDDSAGDAGDDSLATDAEDASDALAASDEGPSDALAASDEGPSDAGTSDEGPSDAGTSDEGTSDAGPSDAGPSDAGDATDASNAMDASEAGDAGEAAALLKDPRLGTASRFAVFAGSTVTNTSVLTNITGDVGTYPSTTAIGTALPVLVGTSAFHLGDLVAQSAATDLVTAYNGLTPASMPGCTSLTGMDLGGKTLAPGIYCFSTSAQLTGALVLDAGLNPNAEWFFQIGSTLTTAALGAAPATVTVINGGNPCNVFWQVGSSATLGTGTAFSGNIVALASITLVTGTTLVGRALSENGAVTLDTNTVSIATCP